MKNWNWCKGLIDDLFGKYYSERKTNIKTARNENPEDREMFLPFEVEVV